MALLRKTKIKASNFTKTSRVLTSLAVISALILAGLTLQLTATPSANAACATGFPTVGWQAIRTTTGADLTDPIDDFSPYPSGGTGDISSATGSPMEWFSSGSGCDFFFRLRLKGDPRKGTGLDNNFFVVAIGRDTTPLVWVGINGEGNNNASYVYAYNPSTSTYLSNLAVNSNNGSDKINIRSVTVGGTTEYFLEWRIANSILPSSVFTTPVGFFAGTSQSNNVTTINADCIDSLKTSGNCAPKYDGTLFVDLTINTDSAVRPNITSISPTKGTTAGGTSVTITGTNLANTSQVYFGGKAATIASSSNTSITVSVSTPASGTTGPVDVYMVNPGGTSNTLVNAFTYITAPVVTTVAASGVAATSAKLNADINPSADLLTAASFCYGTASDLTGCTIIDVTESLASIGSGVSNVRVTKQLSGLTTGTPYYFRISATNSLGTTTGSILNFTPANATLAISTSSLPNGTFGVAYSTSLAAVGGTGTYSSWALTSGTLPTGLSLNTTTGVISGTPSATASSTPLTFTVTDDQPTTSAGANLTLTIVAGPPIATTSNPTSIASTSATFNGTVTANGATTSIYFCLASSGVTNVSGALTCVSTPAASTTNTTTSATVTSVVTGLTSGTIYYYQIYGTNSAGSDYGAVKNFIPASAPEVTTIAASSILASGTTLNGSVTANGSSAAINFCLATGSTVDGNGALTCASTPTSTPSGTLSTAAATATTGPLSYGSTYYFQIYSTNTTGTTYGSVLNFTVTATTTTTVTASPTATTLGGVVNLATAVSPNSATGAVVFKDAANNTLCTVSSLTSGAGNCNWTPESAASFVVTAYYTSDNLSAYSSSTSSTTTVTVNGANSVAAGSNVSTTYGTATTSSAFTSSGGTGAKTWTVLLTSGGSSVSGITISSGGVISVAASTAVGTYSMTVKATDTVGATGTKAATVTVSKANLTVTASSHTVQYGASIPTITPTYSGFVNSETSSSSAFTTGLSAPTCSTEYLTTSAFGSSPTSSCSSADATNYAFLYITGAITIQKRSMTVTASSSSLTYGDAAPTITPSYSGFVNDQTASSASFTTGLTAPTCSTAYLVTSNAGTTPVTSCSVGSAANYTFSSYSAGTVSIAKVNMTLTASSPTVSYGTASVTITPSYSGFVNSQNALSSAFTTGLSAPSCTSTYTNTSAVSSSPSTTCSSGSSTNYLFSTYTSGSVIITRATPTIALVYPGGNSGILVINSTVSSSTNSYSGDGSVTFSTVSTSICSVNSSTGVVTMLAEGNCVVQKSAAEGANYNAINTSTTYVITSASKIDQSALTLVLTPTSKTYSYSQVLTMSTTGGSGTGAVTYAISSGGTATSCLLSDASSSATITTTSNGTCLIEATKAGDSTYNAAVSIAGSFTMNPESQTITFTAPSAMTVGDANQALAPLASSGLTVTLTSNSTSICTIVSNSAYAVTGGSCSITASQSGNSNYSAAASVSRTFTITGATSTSPTVTKPPTITSISAPEVCAVLGALIIRGTSLSGASVTIDGLLARVLTNSQTQLQVVLPSSWVGLKTLVVTNSGGSATTTIEYSFIDSPVYMNFLYPETYKDRAFSYTFNATNAVTYELLGILPLGLTFNSLTGEISGTPTKTGSYEFTIIASNLCDTAALNVYMYVDKAFPTAFTCSVNFTSSTSDKISDVKLLLLRSCLSKVPSLTPKYIHPVIFLSGGAPEGSTAIEALTHPRYLPIIALIESMNIDAQVYFGAFSGQADTVQLNVYWPEPFLGFI